MKFLLDTPISPDKRAIQFSNASSSMEDAAAGDSAEQIAEGTRDSKSVHDKKNIKVATVRPYQFDVLFLGQIGAGNRPGWST